MCFTAEEKLSIYKRLSKLEINQTRITTIFSIGTVLMAIVGTYLGTSIHSLNSTLIDVAVLQTQMSNNTKAVEEVKDVLIDDMADIKHLLLGTTNGSDN